MIRLSEEAPPLSGGSVLTIGNFDGVHVGHRALMEAAAAAAREKRLPSLVWTFSPQGLGGGPLYINGRSEKEFFTEKTGVDMYFSAEFEKYKDMTEERFVNDVLIKRFGARQVLCGYNFSFGRGGKGTPQTLGALLAAHGTPLTVLPPVCVDGAAVSSTEIRALIADGEMEKAAARLGRPYCFILPVARGRGLGRRLGFPTVNQLIPPGRVKPAYGVYAALCRTGGRTYGAVANVGVKPTVGEGEAPACETCIFDFEGDLYGKAVCVCLLKRLRPERRFESLAALSEQIAADKRAAFAVAGTALKEGADECLENFTE